MAIEGYQQRAEDGEDASGGRVRIENAMDRKGRINQEKEITKILRIGIASMVKKGVIESVLEEVRYALATIAHRTRM